MSRRNEIRMSNRAEARQALVARLKTAGCEPKTDNRTGWFSAGDFDAAVTVPDSALLEREPSTEESTAIPARVPNLTEEQKDLLQRIVGVYTSGCHSPFIFLHPTPSRAAILLYNGPQPKIEVRADEFDLQRLATEQFVDVTRDSQGHYAENRRLWGSRQTASFRLHASPNRVSSRNWCSGSRPSGLPTTLLVSL